MYYVVYDWMTDKNGLNLNIADANVFAIILSYTLDKEDYHFGNAWLADKTNLTEQTIKNIIKRLKNNDLIEVRRTKGFKSTNSYKIGHNTLCRILKDVNIDEMLNPH